MVPRVGLEPTTLSLEVFCSIQLSYRGLVISVTFIGAAFCMIWTILPLEHLKH
jgi:hypothetical protein